MKEELAKVGFTTCTHPRWKENGADILVIISVKNLWLFHAPALHLIDIK